MLGFHYLEEAYQNLRQHKLRSILTGFGVTWGIFLLVVLLGAGEGFYQGVFRKFSGYAQNSMWFWGGRRAAGQRVTFTAPLLEKLKRNVAGIKHVSPVAGGYQRGFLSYQGEDYSQASVKGVGISYDQVNQLVVGEGRFLNVRDELSTRPICVIGHDVRSTLFKKEDPIGQFMSVNGCYFQVVGTLDQEAPFNRDEQKSVLIPLQTFHKTFNWGAEFFHFRILLQPGAVSQAVEDKVRTYLSEQLCLRKLDTKTLYVFNLSKQAQNFEGLFRGVRTFLWVIGACMLLSGVVGVSNMMLVIVKERTQEIGIRKVLGATSKEILMMILSESIVISLIAGIVGMLAGIGSLYLINRILDHIDLTQSLLIAHLVFKFHAAIVALLILIIAGAIAGMMPARKATAILPIKALNTE